MERAIVEGRVITFEEYLRMPEVKGRYEIIDGVMRMTPAPSMEHQWLLKRLYNLLDDFVSRRGLGVVFFAPVDVVIAREPLRTRQPDLLFLSKERGGVPSRGAFKGRHFLEAGPDLVVEVLSPSETREEVEEKLADYCRIGVRECWIVSPEAETVEVLRLTAEGPERIGLFGRGDVARGEVLEGFEVKVDEIFG